MAQIVLVTGKPRIGKTAFVVEMLMFDEYYKGRKLFSNINGLKIPHHQPPEGHDWEDLHIWLKWKENIGSVVVYDEAQNLYPTRANGKAMPDHVSWLNIHGHFAIDFIFITQSPKIIDINLREVVGKHIHIAANKMGGLTRLQWNEVAMNPVAQSKNALSSSHKIHDEVFDCYQSAEAHTEHKHVKSRWYYVIMVMLLVVPITLGLVGFLGYRMYTGFKEKIYQEEQFQAASEPSLITGNVSNVLYPNAEIMPQPMQPDQSMKPEQFVPTMAERPESKPIYNSVRQVRQYERIAGCFKGGKSGCTCYSDQATKLKEITAEMCMDYVENGLPFDPFRESEQLAQNHQNLIDHEDTPQVAQLGGQTLPSLRTGDSSVVANIQ